MLPEFSDMTEGHIFLVIFSAALAAASFMATWCGLNGKRRGWVFYSYPGHLVNWPFKMASGGVFLLVILLETLLKYSDYENLARGPFIACLMMPPLLGVACSSFWWPPFLGPRWYREWRASAHPERTAPYSQREITVIRARPDSPQKQRLLAQIDGRTPKIRAPRQRNHGK
ncbi:hypothetical protein [Arthrobacter glacialis]|uniref:Uncharacterized protein n=1 Tax=Arthrobacter glacialis TaxID=1664 RepID=A0A2S4A2R0_ARTGL|nr:hypothetical protein [Arthrobacter glacialis]POH75407.1 hypothetical protein CVS27_02130 [Arthrobacter glacialis]